MSSKKINNQQEASNLKDTDKLPLQQSSGTNHLPLSDLAEFLRGKIGNNMTEEQIEEIIKAYVRAGAPLRFTEDADGNLVLGGNAELLELSERARIVSSNIFVRVGSSKVVSNDITASKVRMTAVIENDISGGYISITLPKSMDFIIG